MNSRLSATLLLAVFIPAAALRGQDAQNDLDKLQGTWTVTALEFNGQAGLKGRVEKITVTFNGDKMVMEGPLDAAKENESIKTEYSVKLDPSKNPKGLDTTTLVGKIVFGIYLLEGDVLKIGLPNDVVKERPSEFKSPEGSDLIVMALKRSKK